MTDHLPPQDLQAEQAVIGACLVAGSVDAVCDIIEPQDFYRPAYRDLYETLLLMAARGMAIDLLSVQGELRDRNLLEACGGGPHLAQLMDSFPLTANAPQYAKRVHEKAIRRRMIAAASQVNAAANDEEAEIEEVIERSARALDHATSGVGAEEIKPFSRHVADTYSFLESSASPMGLTTGLSRLDHWTLGLHPGELTVIAAFTSAGKTTLALGLARHAGKAQVGHVLLYSLEMPAKDLLLRLLAAETGVDMFRLRGKMLSPDDWERVRGARQRLEALPIALFDTSDVTLREVRSRAKALQGNLALVVVDYLQIMRLSGAKGENENQLLSAAALELKRIAMTFNVPVVALSQLNRSAMHEEDKIPELSHLRGSGGIEHTADNVWFIHCPEYHRKARGEAQFVDRAESQIILAKQRNGVRNVRVDVIWNAYCQRFDNLAESDPFGDSHEAS